MTMLFAVFAILALAVLALLINPLLKSPPVEAPSRADYDIAVYRDQLKEIDEEIARGLLTEVQADSARAEVHRRMLAAEDTELPMHPKSAHRNDFRSRLVAIVAITLILPAGAGIMYSALGSPKLPGKGYAWRIGHDPGFAAATTAEQLAIELQQNPTAAGYRRLAQTYFNSRDYERAAAADRRAIELGSKDSVTWSELGEAVVRSNKGSVVPEALQAFANAIESDSRSERSRFYIGLAEAQIGNLKQAVAIWRDLERDSPPNAQWLPMVRGHIAGFSQMGKFDPASIPPSPPSVKSLNAAIAAMNNAPHMQPSASAPITPSLGSTDQNTMIRGMVAQLATRMEKSPNDVAGWERLSHAYMVLGENSKAREAIGNAVRIKPGDVGVQMALAETQKGNGPPGDAMPAAFTATMRGILKLDPSNGQALYYVGLAEQKLGHADVARNMWSKAISVVAADDPIAVNIRHGLDGAPAKPVNH